MSTQETLAGVREGDVLAGKYRVDRVLGVGGMGVVVAAHHVQLDDPVAIKFLLKDTLANKEAVARFAREARAAVKIKSEHVARVTDVGTLENGAPYMVMEYLEGTDLSGWIEARGALPVEQAVDFLLQACEAIAEAHVLGIVHRDLKPANLFVARLPGGVQSVKVLDFGISKLTGLSASGGEASATKTSALMGSPLYMSPEQMQSSKDVDARGDIWALGVILYELLTGVSPFIGETMPELILKIMSSAPPALRSQRADAPEALEAVILRCLEKDRGKRYSSVGELGAALLPFGSKLARNSVDRISRVMQAAGMSASAFVLPPSSAPHEPSAGAGTAAAFGGTTPGDARANPRMLVALAALVVLVGGGVVVIRGSGAAATAQGRTLQASGANAVAVSAVPRAPDPVATAAGAVAPLDSPGAMTAPSVAAVEPNARNAAVTPSSERALSSRLTSSTRPGRGASSPGAPAPPVSPAVVASARPAVPKKPSATSLIDDRR